VQVLGKESYWISVFWQSDFYLGLGKLGQLSMRQAGSYLYISMHFICYRSLGMRTALSYGTETAVKCQEIPGRPSFDWILKKKNSDFSNINHKITRFIDFRPDLYIKEYPRFIKFPWVLGSRAPIFLNNIRPFFGQLMMPQCRQQNFRKWEKCLTTGGRQFSTISSYPASLSSS